MQLTALIGIRPWVPGGIGSYRGVASTPAYPDPHDGDLVPIASATRMLAQGGGGGQDGLDVTLPYTAGPPGASLALRYAHRMLPCHTRKLHTSPGGGAGLAAVTIVDVAQRDHELIRPRASPWALQYSTPLRIEWAPLSR